MIIRPEHPADINAIAHVVEQAFGQPDEARLVEQLRRDGDAMLSLVAEQDGKVVGHVLLSPMTAPFRALGLAPLAVLPAHQNTGIGAALAKAAIAYATTLGWSAIFVLGDPAYYSRFGFSAERAAKFTSPYAGPHFMVLPLGTSLPTAEGKVDYAPAFSQL